MILIENSKSLTSCKEAASSNVVVSRGLLSNLTVFWFLYERAPMFKGGVSIETSLPGPRLKFWRGDPCRTSEIGLSALGIFPALLVTFSIAFVYPRRISGCR